MTTFIAANLTLFFFALIAGLMERAHRRYTQQPHVPFGAEPTQDTDLQRVLHDIDSHR